MEAVKKTVMDARSKTNAAKLPGFSDDRSQYLARDEDTMSEPGSPRGESPDAYLAKTKKSRSSWESKAVRDVRAKLGEYKENPTAQSARDFENSVAGTLDKPDTRILDMAQDFLKHDHSRALEGKASKEARELGWSKERVAGDVSSQIDPETRVEGLTQDQGPKAEAKQRVAKSLEGYLKNPSRASHDNFSSDLQEYVNRPDSAARADDEVFLQSVLGDYLGSDPGEKLHFKAGKHAEAISREKKGFKDILDDYANQYGGHKSLSDFIESNKNAGLLGRLR